MQLRQRKNLFAQDIQDGGGGVGGGTDPVVIIGGGGIIGAAAERRGLEDFLMADEPTCQETAPKEMEK